MIDIKGQYFIKDNHKFRTDQVEVLASDAILIYEVLRVIGSVCLFTESHYNRLKRSAQLTGVQLDVTFLQFEDNIAQLIQANNIREGNIKVLVQVGRGKQAAFYYLIPHNYPTTDDYKNGVKAGLMELERSMPKAKIVQQKLREETNRFIQKEKIYDAILVDSEGHVTEGSRTNIFFVKGDTFYTAPSEHILSGITRQKVLECLAELKYNRFEKPVSYLSISDYDAAFFTGTSPRVLPIYAIGSQKYNVNHDPMRKLIDAYNKLVESYLAKAQAKKM
ncbi:aminotransferase class IV [Sunxiuqinia indica]|uniref:aminotransferase class IV n=1 Tax=Sunxiuqinia indica TaxID=2692584 RepID=UPI001358CF04|nr:aminotransferase class IV [Sunxiuqinia indica]